MSNIKYIYRTVDQLIDKYDTRDPFKICKDSDIHLYYTDLGSALKAYYFYQSRIKNIVINSNAGSVVRRILCAHELGHATLHGKMASMKGFRELGLFDSLIPTEYEANLFAAELIISDEDLLNLLEESDGSLFSIASELYVPFELLDFKLKIMKTKGHNVNVPCISASDFLKRDITGGIYD